MRPIEEIKKNHRLMIVREGWDGFMAYLCRIVLGGDFSDFVTRWHPMGR